MREFFAWCVAAVSAVAMHSFAFGDETALESQISKTGYLRLPHRAALTNAQAEPKPAMRFLTKATPLPASWDSRDLGWISPKVKNQGNVGACWAFTVYETLETQMRRLGLGEHDFSEKNMVNLHGYSVDFDDGGNNDMAAAYLLRWGGAVAETNDVYISSSSQWKNAVSHPMNSIAHVQDVVWIAPREDCYDNNALKEAVMEYGAVAVGCRMRDSSSYCNTNGAYYSPYTLTKYDNHAVTVIGWDDNYSTNNFKIKPPSPGAWLVKNSWGTDKGDHGYFYVSYMEPTFFTRAYSDPGAVFLPAADTNYNAVYGYDRLGACLYGIGGKEEAYKIGAKFIAAWNEELAAIGTYTCIAPLEYSISIYTNVTEDAANPRTGGRLAHTQTGILTHAGYTAIPLTTPVPLVPGEMYGICFESLQNTERFFALTYAFEGYSENVVLATNKTFYTIGSSWYDSAIENENMLWVDIDNYLRYANGNICLKAYTRSTVLPKDMDSPSESESGQKMLDDLAATNNVLYAQAAQTFGALAHTVGANGRTLWTSWLLGLDPNSETSNDFTLNIDVSNDTPTLTWTPDLGEKRKYTIWGASTLANPSWEEIEDPASSSATFFKVTVEP